jgi:molybdopterin-containing oxidoreductase family iron-sulfur binding subunit
LRLLTGNVTSLPLAAQIAALQKQFPAMRWHRWEPLHRDNEFAASQRAFGRLVERVFDVGAADVIFAVESDLISAVPGWLAYARQFAARRRPDETGGRMSRVYAIESTPTLIGAKADHRLPMRPEEILDGMRHLAATVGAGPQEWAQSQTKDASWLTAVAQDLMQHKGRALVHAGREQPVEVHFLADAINGALGAFGKTIRPIEPVAASPMQHQQSLQELAADMIAGRVDTLLMLETNPLYSAPVDLDFAAALKRVPLSVSLALYADETAEGEHLADSGHPRIRSLERCARVRRHSHNPAAAGTQAVRRPFGAGAVVGAASRYVTRRLRAGARLLAASGAAERERQFRGVLA